MTKKGFKRNTKAIEKFHTLAIEALEVYGSASSGVLFDYVKHHSKNSQRWLPLKQSVNSWMSRCDKVYRGSDSEWRLKN